MIRKINFSSGWKWFGILVILVAASCTNIKYGLYNMALDHERSKAGLALKHIELDGKPIAFLENEPGQNKPTFVLLHGFSANKDNWIRFAGYLTDDYHIVALDLPGHGDSFKNMDMPYDIDDQVRYLNGIFHILNLEAFSLAGNSMGGAISSLYAATYPDQVTCLMLFAPGGIYKYESELNRQLKQGKNPLIVANADDFDRLMDFVMEKKPFMPWPVTSVLAEKAVANKPINNKIFEDIRGGHNFDFEAALGKITAPTLIIWGKEDRVLNIGNADVFQELIHGSKKVALEGIGHVPMIEDPEATAGICREFISANAKPAKSLQANSK